MLKYRPIRETWVSRYACEHDKACVYCKRPISAVCRDFRDGRCEWCHSVKFIPIPKTAPGFQPLNIATPTKYRPAELKGGR